MGRIVRVISKDASVVCSAIDGKDIVSRIEEIHKTSAVVTAALGKLAMGTSLMGFGLKGKDDSITVKMDGDGAVQVRLYAYLTAWEMLRHMYKIQWWNCRLTIKASLMSEGL